MPFVRSSSKSDPAIIKAYFNDALPAAGPRNAQARRANGVKYWSTSNRYPASHRLMINGVHIPFEEISADAPLAGKLGQVQAQIENALRVAGASPAMADELSYLLCDGAFVGGDGKAVNQVLAGTAEFGEPASRELNVIVDGDGITVHRRSTWSKCERGATAEAKQTVSARNLLTIDSGVRFFSDRNKQGQVEISARPDYWAHSVAKGDQFAFIGEGLKAAPAGSTVWDRFVDALAWLVGARGIRFERAENLDKSQRRFLQERRGAEAREADIALAGRGHCLTAIDLGAATVKTYRNALPALAVDEEITVRINNYRRCHAEVRKQNDNPEEDMLVRQQKAQARAKLEQEAAQEQATLQDLLIGTGADLLWSANKVAEADFVRSIIGLQAGEATRLALQQGSTLGLAIAVMVDIGRLRDKFVAERLKSEETRDKLYGADEITPYLCDGIIAQAGAVAIDDDTRKKIHERLSDACALIYLIDSFLCTNSSTLYRSGFEGIERTLADTCVVMMASMEHLQKAMQGGAEQFRRSTQWVERISGTKRSERNMFDPVDCAGVLLLCGVPIAEIRAALGQG